MRRLWLFAMAAPLLLGSAIPPPLAAPPLAARALPPIAPVTAAPEPLLAAPAPTPAPAAPEPVAPAAPLVPAPAPIAAAQVKEAKAAPVAKRPKKAAKASSGKGVRVLVSIPQQKIWVFKNGELAFTAPVSTGKRGHRTPVGTFPILQKKVHHRSSKYDNAPMPYMQRLTHYGIALHAGHLPGYPASHGCIRLPRSYAKKLYGLTNFSTRVTITNKRPKSAKEALRIA